MSSCAVLSCYNNAQETKKERGPSLAFHRFPTSNPNLCELWLKKCKKSINTATARICSDHFTSNDYEYDMRNHILGIPKRLILKPNVFPTVFDITNNSNPNQSFPEPEVGQDEEEEEMDDNFSTGALATTSNSSLDPSPSTSNQVLTPHADFFSSGPKKPQTVLTIEEKYEILQLLQQKVKTNQEICREWNISNSAVGRITGNRAKITESYLTGHGKIKRHNLGRQPHVDKALFKWYLERKSIPNVVLTNKMLRKQAEFFAQSMNISSSKNNGSNPEDGNSPWVCSPSWINRFCARHKIDLKQYKKKGSKDQESEPNMDLDFTSFIKEEPLEFSEYEDEDVGQEEDGEEGGGEEEQQRGSGDSFMSESVQHRVQPVARATTQGNLMQQIEKLKSALEKIRETAASVLPEEDPLRVEGLNVNLNVNVNGKAPAEDQNHHHQVTISLGMCKTRPEDYEEIPDGNHDDEDDDDDDEESTRSIILKSSRTILVHSVGFHGPSSQDSKYKVKLCLFQERCKRLAMGGDDDDRILMGRTTSIVQAKKNCKFHLKLKKPIMLKAGKKYTIEYKLWGPQTLNEIEEPEESDDDVPQRFVPRKSQTLERRRESYDPCKTVFDKWKTSEAGVIFRISEYSQDKGALCLLNFSMAPAYTHEQSVDVGPKFEYASETSEESEEEDPFAS